MEWLKVVAASLWPIAILVASLVLLRSDRAVGLLKAVSDRIRAVSAFGVQVDLTLDNAERLRDDIEKVVEGMRMVTKREFDHLVHLYNATEQHRQVVEEHVMPLLRDDVKRNFRSTVYVPGVLFQDQLYQLLNYYPNGDGRGRTFSARFGIIGITWRLGQHQIEGQIPTDPGELVRTWGMNSEEATAAGQGRHSFACVLMRTNNGRLGLFYLDALGEHAFGTNDAERQRLCQAILDGVEVCGLIPTLSKINEEMRRRGPPVQIYDTSRRPH